MSIDGRSRRETSVQRFLRTPERISLAVEQLLAGLVRKRSPLQPALPHRHHHRFLLLLIILVTGVYLTMFYPVRVRRLLPAVAIVQASLVRRVIRALHRYASDLADHFVLLHGWRTFFMDRFAGRAGWPG